jgi:hypothetical protein
MIKLGITPQHIMSTPMASARPDEQEHAFVSFPIYFSTSLKFCLRDVGLTTYDSLAFNTGLYNMN